MYIETWGDKLINSQLTEEKVAATVFVDMHLYCPDGATLIRKQISDGNYEVYCRINFVCPAPYVANSSGQCDLHCENAGGATAARKCAPPPKQEYCPGATQNPIRLTLGNKIRHEHVITTAGSSPIDFTFQYNNQNNNEQTFVGRIAPASVGSMIIDTRPGIPYDQYSLGYTDQGLEQSSISAEQYFGNVNRYWRHNFDEQILTYNGHYIYHAADGQSHEFTASGTLKTLVGSSFEQTQNGGFKLTDAKTGRVKYFDNSGKLVLIRDGGTQLALEYEAAKLVKVSNGFGKWLTFDYSDEETNFSIYSRAREPRKYISKVSSSDGRSVDIGWGHNHFGRADGYRLITRITDPYIEAPSTAREYGYLDPRWPASLTNISVVTDMEKQLRRPYLKVEYDDQGRAIYSGLAGGVDATRVNYLSEMTRVVTNALGKEATYSFEVVDGVRRLTKVVGEPTSNCLRSEVEYVYNADGTFFEKHQNDRTTRYVAYDSKQREIERIEAVGTPEARTVTTEYHPTLNLPVRITEPGRVEVMTYDESGRLLSKNIQPTTAHSP